MDKLDKGLYDNAAMCDKLIADLNNATKCLFNGQGIAFCDAVRMIAQGLASLKNGIEKDMADREETIRQLKQEIEDLRNGRTE